MPKRKRKHLDNTQPRPNWFARASMNAAMADNPAYMQAVGWEQDRKGNYHQNPKSKGAEELSKALFEIGLNGAMDVFGGPILEKGVEAAAKYYKEVKNVAKSQKYLKDLSEQLGNIYVDFTETPIEKADKLAAIETLKKKLYGENADITELAYFKDNNNVKRVGRYIKSDDGIHKWNNLEDAIVNETDIKNTKPVTTKDVLNWAEADFNRVNPGHTVALVDNEALSKDSYPLLQSLAKRRTLHNQGKITPVVDNGNYRMMLLNRYGKNKKGIKRVDEAIRSLREVTGDSNIPNRVNILGNQYVPAFTFTKYKYGGSTLI